jgi:hypothetical protein
VTALPEGSDGDFCAVLRATPASWQRFTLVSHH